MLFFTPLSWINSMLTPCDIVTIILFYLQFKSVLSPLFVTYWDDNKHKLLYLQTESGNNINTMILIRKIIIKLKYLWLDM